jgi:cytochrome P450
MATQLFVPPHPPRGDGPVPVWMGFFGERARSSVAGWSTRAFTERHMQVRVLGWNVHIPLDPDSVQQVLQGNAAAYVKPTVVKRLSMALIGRGLLTSDGELWREQRRIVAANFAPAAVDALLPQFAAAAEATAQAWRDGDTHDLAEAATDTTMRIIADSLFGGDPRLKTRAAMDHIAAALAAAADSRLAAMLGVPPIPWNRRMLVGQRGRNFLRRILADVVRERGPDGGADDFLGKLIRALRARFEPAEALALAVDNAATFYLAGHETTANAVTWTLYLLAAQPDWQERVAAEAAAALAAGRDDPDLPDRLPTLRRVLEEAMRLYPPVPRFDREAAGADRLGGRDVAAGDIVSIWPWLLHRHQAYWEEPDAFDPDRFLPERRAAMHRFQYIPFGAGPRICVGMRFAQAEALTIIATWLEAWRFELCGEAVEPTGMVTLRPRGGLRLRTIRRQRD